MPTIEKCSPRNLGPKPWGTELLFAETTHYLGKVLCMKARHGGHLQYHATKDEAFYLLYGHAIVRYHDANGVLQAKAMYAGEAYHVPPGAVHQVEAVTDCIFVEVSTPVFDDRIVVQDFEGAPI